MTKFDIRSPGIADRYPMRILWVEDRKDHVVEEGDVVAVYTTPRQDQRRMTAPFTGKVTRVFVTRGMMLKGPTALMEFSRLEDEEPIEEVAEAIPAAAAAAPEPVASAPPEAPRAAPEAARTAPNAAAEAVTPAPDPARERRRLRRMPDAATIDAVFDRILGPKRPPEATAMPTPSRSRKLTWGEALLILALIATGAGVFVWKERPDLLAALQGPPPPYDGPMSLRAAQARTIDAALLSPAESMQPFGVGQGTIEIFQTPESIDYVYCPAVAVGPHAVAFSETCGRTVLDAQAGAPAPTIYFRARRIRGDAIESLVYPVTEIHRWLDPADTGIVAIAIVAPADGGSVADDTGRSGFALVDTASPPPYLQLDTAPRSPAAMMASRGCTYHTEDEPTRDEANGLHSFTAKVGDCIDATESGYLRLPIDGAFYFGGFYVAEPAAASDGGIATFPQLFGSRDNERMVSARGGEPPQGSSVVRATGLPYQSGLYLANACATGVTFYFREPGADIMQNIDLAGGQETRVSNAPFSGDFLWSIGLGRPSDGVTTRVEFNDKTYYMRRGQTVRGDVVLRNPC